MPDIKFFNINEEYGDFSNFSRHEIFLDGKMWPTVEHYFQAQKFLDGELRMKIVMAKTPMEAARIGRDKSLPLRPDWEDVKIDVMKKAVKAKVLQHIEVKELLLSTDNCNLFEHTKNDSFWGDGGDGSGKNMLGKILQEIRQEVASLKRISKEEFLLPPWQKYIGIANTDIFWRFGKGDDYLDEWVSWFITLDDVTRDMYIANFPEPEEWSGFYENQKLK